jgi:polyisoprenoid-binding protein YceI
MRRLLLPALLTLATAPLLAQMPTTAPGTKDPAKVTAGSYAVDPNHTLVGWRVNHLGFNDYFGIFGEVAGTLSLDPKKPNEAKLDVTIPISKVVTASAGLTAHLLKPAAEGGKPDFFGANPVAARFVSTKVAASGTRAKITGNLTLNGVTRPVTLDAEFTGAGKMGMPGAKDTVGFEAKAAIKRSEFGLGNAVPLVSDEVELDITAAFEKQ